MPAAMARKGRRLNVLGDLKPLSDNSTLNSGSWINLDAYSEVALTAELSQKVENLASFYGKPRMEEIDCNSAQCITVQFKLDNAIPENLLFTSEQQRVLEDAR